MIRLPNGQELRAPRAGKLRLIGDVQYSERDLFRADIMAQLGIREVVRVGFDSNHYDKTGEEEVDDGKKVTITPTTRPKFSVNGLAKRIGAKAKGEALSMYEQAKVHYDRLTDPDHPVADPADPYVAEFENFRAGLKTTFQAIKTELTEIVMGAGTDAEKYDQLIAYTWQDRWPAPPTNVE